MHPVEGVIFNLGEVGRQRDLAQGRAPPEGGPSNLGEVGRQCNLAQGRAPSEGRQTPPRRPAWIDRHLEPAAVSGHSGNSVPAGAPGPPSPDAGLRLCPRWLELHLRTTQHNTQTQFRFRACMPTVMAELAVAALSVCCRVRFANGADPEGQGSAQ